MKHAIEIAGKYLGGLVASATLAGLAAAQHVLPHRGLYSLEGDVIEDPARGFTLRAGKLRGEEGLRLAVEIAPEQELDGRAITHAAVRRRLCLTGGIPGSPAALHVARRVVFAGETQPVAGHVVRGLFDVRGHFRAELPASLDLGGLVAQGAALRNGEISITIDLEASAQAAVLRWTLAGRLASPVRADEPVLGMSAPLAFPRRKALERE